MPLTLISHTIELELVILVYNFGTKINMNMCHLT